MFLRAVGCCQYLARRSMSLTTIGMQQAQTDPVQQLFVEKLRDYGKKQKAQTNPDMLVDASADQTKAYNDELERISRMYQVKKGEDMREFPKLDFKEPTYPAVQQPQKQEPAVAKK